VVGLSLDPGEEEGAIFRCEGETALERTVGIQPGAEMTGGPDPGVAGFILLPGSGGSLDLVCLVTQLTK
jgi:hypothetical protein